MSREAVLLEWERKIEAAEARPGRFDRPAARTDTSTAPEAGHEISTHAARRPPGAGSSAPSPRPPASAARSPSRAGPRRPAACPEWPSGSSRSPTGLRSGRSCWACSWWLWPPGPHTPERPRAIRAARACVLPMECVIGLFFPILTAGKRHAESEVQDEDQGEQVPGSRRADGSRAKRARAQGRTFGRRPAPELPRSARWGARGAARVRALPLGASARIAPVDHRPAHRAGRGRAPGQRVRAVHAPAHGARRRARPRRDRAGTRVRLARRARGGAAAIHQGAAPDRRSAASSTSWRRRARPAGPTSRSSRRWPRWRWPRSPTSSPAPPTFPVDGSPEGSRLLQAA